MFTSCCACVNKKSNKKALCEDEQIVSSIDEPNENEQNSDVEINLELNTPDTVIVVDENVRIVKLKDENDVVINDNNDGNSINNKIKDVIISQEPVAAAAASAVVATNDLECERRINEEENVTIKNGKLNVDTGSSDGILQNVENVGREETENKHIELPIIITTSSDDDEDDDDVNNQENISDNSNNSTTESSSQSSSDNSQQNVPIIVSHQLKKRPPTPPKDKQCYCGDDDGAGNRVDEDVIKIEYDAPIYDELVKEKEKYDGIEQVIDKEEELPPEELQIVERDNLENNVPLVEATNVATDLPKSCINRRRSSSIKKKVKYSLTNNDIVPLSIMDIPSTPPTSTSTSPDEEMSNGGSYNNTHSESNGNGCGGLVDDDEVFSDSISPKVPRGDMCTPYPKKKGSLTGLMALPDWFNDDRESGGILEPPVTPIGRDELALKRHRFFSELLVAAQAATEHRVRFNPLGPDILNSTSSGKQNCDPDLKPSTAAELGHLVDRLEKIVERLERTVSARELESINHQLNAVIQKTDSEELDSLPLPSPPPSTLPNFQILTGSTDSGPAALTDNFDYFIQFNGSGDKDSIDLDSLPTVLSQIISTEEYLSQEEPDFLPPPPQSQPTTPTVEPINMAAVEEYKDIIAGSLQQFLQLSKTIGGEVATHAKFVEDAFAAQLRYVTLAATSSKPSADKQQELLKPTSEQITNIQSFREKNRVSPLFNHLSAISESIPALGWVCVAPTPGPHVKEMIDAGQFYTNRVLKDWKEKNPVHVEWARSWIQTLTELQKYIRQHHTTGLVFSGKTPVSEGGAPPPPPGIPPPPPALPPLGDLSLTGDERSALFAQINQGEDITKSLKKVTSDMQTHKNTALRTGPAPFKAPASTATSQKVAAPVAASAVVKEPVFLRDGKKWLIEYQKSNPNLLVEDAEMNNVVYLFKCENSTLTVKGKINGIIMDSCKKCSILFDSVVASVEFVNCQSVQVQVLGHVPTISIDKTDGCQMYLSEKALEVEIISSKSSEMNVLIPKGNGDYIEKPIPEQFKTKINGEQLNTICVESLG